MLPELGMDTNDFNYGQTIFLVSFLAAELPSGLISKKVGPDRLQLNKGPSIGSLAASGILEMRGIHGWSGWQYLFLIEGVITGTIGLFSWTFMPASPCHTSGRSRGSKGWFTEREEKIMVNRLLRDDPSKGDMNNRQAVGLRGLIKSFWDFDLWPTYVVGLCAYIPPNPPGTYLAFTLKQLGFSTFHANLLTIPGYFGFLINLLIITKASSYFKERAIISSISNIWMFPFLVSLVAIGADASYWVRYALLTGIVSYPYCHAILVGWNAKNSNTVRTRAVSAALYNMFVQAGSVISTNIYREDDKPLYIRGNKILLSICSLNIVLFYLVKIYYVGRNAKRDAVWNAMSAQEQEIYVATTKDEGAKRLDFRFAH
ncbi:putative transporter [Diplocarpon rosae]|nr:putative transporter [Diplocarpon rosae]